MEKYILEIIIICLNIAVVVILAIFCSKKKQNNDGEILEKLIKQNNEEIFRSYKAETDKVISVQSENLRFLSNNIQNIINSMSLNNKQLEDRFLKLTEMNEKKLDKVTETIQSNLKNIQQDNSKQLDLMRQTVDEKLNVTLERRLNDSFNLISNRLEAVTKGLGEMQSLATGVGDLKKVLQNVKTRGMWGEVSLNNLLEQMLTQEQFVTQFKVNPNSSELVDFAVKLPGKDDKNIYLSIDAKFPIEDYVKLVEASESGDIELIETCKKNLLKRIKDEAKDISAKYICPPYTTDFAIMYLPIEGLYAEVVKEIGLIEQFQRDYKIMVCGPTTLSALLNSLQMGFKTLAIQKRSSEVWSMLNMFKKEFSKFCELLEKTQKKLSEASNTIEDASKKTATIQRKLNKVSTFEEIDETEDNTILTILNNDETNN